jgi:hypothetical protein
LIHSGPDDSHRSKGSWLYDLLIHMVNYVHNDVLNL